MYSLLHGEIHASLTGNNGQGWATISKVQETRKKIRKLNIGLRQEEQDLDTTMYRLDMAKNKQLAKDSKANQGSTESDCFDDGHGEDAEETVRESLCSDGIAESLGLADGTSVEDLQGKIAATQRKIADEECSLTALLHSGLYTPRVLSLQITRFMSWYISTGELFCPSGLHSILRGQVNPPLPHSAPGIALQTEY